MNTIEHIEIKATYKEKQICEKKMKELFSHIFLIIFTQ